jgi:hypothetical protein
MNFLSPIQTPYGIARVIGKTADGGYLVSLPKAAMTVTHPNYRNGPCVNWIFYP